VLTPLLLPLPPSLAVLTLLLLLLLLLLLPPHLPGQGPPTSKLRVLERSVEPGLGVRPLAEVTLIVTCVPAAAAAAKQGAPVSTLMLDPAQLVSNCFMQQQQEGLACRHDDCGSNSMPAAYAVSTTHVCHRGV
jgi:hypothetical protein